MTASTGTGVSTPLLEVAALVLALAVIGSLDGQKGFTLTCISAVLAVAVAIVVANLAFGLWVFHLARPRAPPLQRPSGPPRVSLEWSAVDEFPENFAPLMALKHLVASTEGITGSLVTQLTLLATAELQPGQHALRISPQATLSLTVAEKQCQARLTVQAGHPAPKSDAVCTNVSLELPKVQLSGIAGALDALWELWAGDSILGAPLRRACVVAIRALEAALSIRLTMVEAHPAGENLLLFFTGTIGPIPFVRLHLPAFVLPRIHAPLSRLLSNQPIAGHRFRPGVKFPIPHPSVLSEWTSTLDATFTPFGVDGFLRLEDGSRSSFSIVVVDEGKPFHIECEVGGSLDEDQLRTEIKSFSLETLGRGSRRGVYGRASGTLARKPHGSGCQRPDESLADIIFDAACRQSLDVALNLDGSFSLESESELPGAYRCTIDDEHPLLLGRANVSLLLEHLRMWGSGSFHQELPMWRKRDFLVLPEVNLHFNTALTLEEDSSFVDDGSATLRFQGAHGSVDGRVWSYTKDCIQAEAELSASLRALVEVRDSSFVQALLEAEAAAAHFNDTFGSLRDGAKLEAHSHHDEAQASRHFAVRADDVVQLKVGGKAHSIMKFEVVCSSREPGDNASTSYVRKGSGLSRTLSLDQTVNLDHLRTKMLLLSAAESTVDFELGEVAAHVGDLALSLPPVVKVHVDVEESAINAEGIGQTRLQVSWTGLGQAIAQHTGKKLTATLPPLPSAGSATVRIGDMGQMSFCYDGKVDRVALGNRLLDEEAMYGPFLELAEMLDLRLVLEHLLTSARVVRNVLRSEGIEEVGDTIPTSRMARLLARVLLEIGTAGEHTADEAQSPLERDLFHLLKQTMDAKGLDVAKLTRLLWDFLPANACSVVQHYTAEVNFVFKWLDSILRPTEATQGCDPSTANEPPPSYKYRRDLQEVVPFAARLYEAIDRPGPLSRDLEAALFRTAAYFTVKQVEYILRRCELSPQLQQRFKFLLGLKRRVEIVAEGYGGPAFMPQGMAVGFFLATAIRGSFVGSERTVGPAGKEADRLAAPQGAGSARA